jgi:hypothetical protein
MPIRAYLKGHRFDAETTRLMGIAFEMALVALQHTDGIINPTRDAVAKKIIELAKAGERDPGRLCDAALQALQPSLRPDALICHGADAAPHLAVDQPGAHLEVVHGLPHNEKAVPDNGVVN